MVNASVGALPLRNKAGLEVSRLQRTNLVAADLRNARLDGVDLLSCQT